jgi:cbb3-type cytochrome oxidase subunit 3
MQTFLTLFFFAVALGVSCYAYYRGKKILNSDLMKKAKPS